MQHGRGPGCLPVAARGCLVVDGTPFLSPITLSLSCSPGPPGPAVGGDAFSLNRRREGHHSLVMASLPHTRLAADAGAGFQRVTAVPGHTL